MLLTLFNIKKVYSKREEFFKKPVLIEAVKDISFHIQEKEIFALVGESGSGKTTVAKLIARFIYPTEGKILWQGKNIYEIPQQQYAHYVQLVFQNPFSSLNPKLKIGTILKEALLQREKPLSKKHIKIKEEIAFILKKVQLPLDILSHYPYQFSGGQRQRISLARALLMRPKLILADEPVSSLDISIQAQILNLMLDLRDDFGLSYLLIAHDLNIVKAIADRIAVMEKGRIVEINEKKELFTSPIHPYTIKLLQSIPRL